MKNAFFYIKFAGGEMSSTVANNTPLRGEFQDEYRTNIFHFPAVIWSKFRLVHRPFSGA
jgi:hypothetical protein